MPCLCLVVVFLLINLGFPAVASAQPVDVEVLTVGIGGAVGLSGTSGGLYRCGAWVPVKVRLKCKAPSGFTGYVGVEQSDLDGDRVQYLSRRFTLTAEDTLHPRDWWFYYWPTPSDGGTGIPVVKLFDESKRPVADFPLPASSGVGIMPRDEATERGSRMVVLVGSQMHGTPLLGFSGYTGSRGGWVVTRYATAKPLDLPDQAIGLDGVDTVIWSEPNANELPDEFQQAALLQWVRAGGHLILTVGENWQAVADPKHELAKALPMDFTGTRTLDHLGIMGTFLRREAEAKFADVPGPFVQVIGTLRPGANAIQGGLTGDMAKHPLVVSGTYGAGTVTVVTIDLTAVQHAKPLEETDRGLWLDFWSLAAGWPGRVMTEKAYNDAIARNEQANIDHGYRSASIVKLDGGIARSIDLTRETSLRLLLAVLFLGGYWAIAGPLGHVVLRKYKITHLSWWIFGVTVLVASGVAMLAVSSLQLQNTDLRHTSFVMGQVGRPEATVVGYYGLFVPTPGQATLELPEGTGYLATLNEPNANKLNFADPQSYQRECDQARSLTLPFRNTLRKLQTRWTGNLSGQITGNVTAALRESTVQSDSSKPLLQGTLSNHTGYDLSNVRLVYVPEGREAGSGFLFSLGEWKNESDLVLQNRTIRDSKGTGKIDNGEYLFTALDRIQGDLTHQGRIDDDGNPIAAPGDGMELVTIFLESHAPRSPLENTGHRIFQRHLMRTLDRSNALRASRLVILAKAKGKSPLPLLLGGKNPLTGDGDTLFLWTAPVAKPAAETKETP